MWARDFSDVDHNPIPAANHRRSKSARSMKEKLRQSVSCEGEKEWALWSRIRVAGLQWKLGSDDRWRVKRFGGMEWVAYPASQRCARAERIWPKPWTGGKGYPRKIAGGKQAEERVPAEERNGLYLPEAPELASERGLS